MSFYDMMSARLSTIFDRVEYDYFCLSKLRKDFQWYIFLPTCISSRKPIYNKINDKAYV